jgi:hypothetical protein
MINDPWASMEKQLHAATVSAFGTRWRFTPMTARANKAAVQDPARASVVLCAVFSDPHQNERLRHKFTEVSTSNPTLEVHSSQVADIRQGDVFTRFDGCGNEVARYEVAAPQANGFGTYRCELVQLGLRASA